MGLKKFLPKRGKEHDFAGLRESFWGRKRLLREVEISVFRFVFFFFVFLGFFFFFFFLFCAYTIAMIVASLGVP